MRLRQHNPDEETRDAIKKTAQRLFALRGIDGVSVREIVVAAGQRNGGSLHYHFGTKEALVRELIVDGAKLIDDRRRILLGGFESGPHPPTLRQIIEVLVWPSINFAKEDGGVETYIRFINVLQMSHRQMFLDALNNQWNSGYLRCLELIRKKLPNIPPVVMNRRLVFMGIYLPAILAARESALDEQKGSHPFWSAPHVIDTLVESLENLINGPVSKPARPKPATRPARASVKKSKTSAT